MHRQQLSASERRQAAERSAHCQILHIREVRPVCDLKDGAFNARFSGTNFLMCVMCDGYNGSGAASHFAVEVASNITRLVESFVENEGWVRSVSQCCVCFAFPCLLFSVCVCESLAVGLWQDFSADETRYRLSDYIQCVFQEIDADYLEKKRKQFEDYAKQAQSCPDVDAMEIEGQEAMQDKVAKAVQPVDDGCSVSVCVLSNDWMVTASLGGSRIALCPVEGPFACNGRVCYIQPLPVVDSKAEEWTCTFATNDHSPGHLPRALETYAHGGRFYDPATLEMVSVPFTPQNASSYMSTFVPPPFSFNQPHFRVDLFHPAAEMNSVGDQSDDCKWLSILL